MIVVEDPHAHIALFCLAEDNVHVAPPAVSRKITMRTGFHAERPATALVDALHLGRDGRGVIAVLPIEGEHIVAGIAGQNVDEVLIHKMTPCLWVWFDTIVQNHSGLVNRADEKIRKIL